MAFQLQVMSDAERQEQVKNRGRFFAEGRCDFEVMAVDEAVSKSGNDMLVMSLKVWDKEGASGMIKDYFVSSQQWKLHDFLDAVGRSEDYKKHGAFNKDNLIGCSGVFYLKYKADKEGNDQKNIKYVANMPKEEVADSIDADFNDDVPF